MLLKHLQLLKCPICKSSGNWTSDGYSNDYHITDGSISCQNNHTWIVKQDVLRMNKENSIEDIIYSERELTGYPKEVVEIERAEFLDFIEQYFRNIEFSRDNVVIIGEPILFYRFLSEVNNSFITVYKDEKVLRQLHEATVRKRLHNEHSFLRAETIDVINSPKLYIFENQIDTALEPGDLLLQFRSNEIEPQGTVLWKGQKCFLEELTG